MSEPSQDPHADLLVAPPGQPRGNERLPRSLRLRRTTDFKAAYAQNRKFSGRHMILFLREAPDSCLRLGVVAGRSVGGAVQRNRARRRLRELFRRERAHLSGPVDVVLVARASSLSASWDELRADFEALARRAQLWKSSPEASTS